MIVVGPDQSSGQNDESGVGRGESPLEDPEVEVGTDVDALVLVAAASVDVLSVVAVLSTSLSRAVELATPFAVDVSSPLLPPHPSARNNHPSSPIFFTGRHHSIRRRLSND
jgi:hypothetical protein